MSSRIRSKGPSLDIYCDCANRSCFGPDLDRKKLHTGNASLSCMLALSSRRLVSTSLARPPRCLSTSTLSPTHQIYISNSTNPYFNLSLEDWFVSPLRIFVYLINFNSTLQHRLFRTHTPSSPLLLLYRDSPCVVIGRNQNPWKEVSLAAARERWISWIRRRSGGGAVFHVSCYKFYTEGYGELNFFLGFGKYEFLDPPLQGFIQPECYSSNRITSCSVSRDR
jgi:hypothetical protein